MCICRSGRRCWNLESLSLEGKKIEETKNICNDLWGKKNDRVFCLLFISITSCSFLFGSSFSLFFVGGCGSMQDNMMESGGEPRTIDMIDQVSFEGEGGGCSPCLRYC